MNRERQKPRHVLRETTNPEVIARIQRADLADPIGGQDAAGRWWVDTKLASPQKR